MLLLSMRESSASLDIHRAAPGSSWPSSPDSKTIAERLPDNFSRLIVVSVLALVLAARSR